MDPWGEAGVGGVFGNGSCSNLPECLFRARGSRVVRAGSAWGGGVSSLCILWVFGVACERLLSSGMFVSAGLVAVE